MPPVINKEKCVGCQICADICPVCVFALPGKETGKVPPEILFPDECWHCNACVLDCTADAITLRIPINYNLLYIDASQLNPKKEER